MELPNYMTPDQYVQARAAQDAGLILSLLASVQALKAALAERDARLAVLDQVGKAGADG